MNYSYLYKKLSKLHSKMPSKKALTVINRKRDREEEWSKLDVNTLLQWADQRYCTQNWPLFMDICNQLWKQVNKKPPSNI